MGEMFFKIDLLSNFVAAIVSCIWGGVSMSTVDPLQCFIGIPTSQITSNHDESDKRISKIGGQPVSVFWTMDVATFTKQLTSSAHHDHVIRYGGITCQRQAV